MSGAENRRPCTAHIEGIEGTLSARTFFRSRPHYYTVRVEIGIVVRDTTRHDSRGTRRYFAKFRVATRYFTAFVRVKVSPPSPSRLPPASSTVHGIVRRRFRFTCKFASFGTKEVLLSRRWTHVIQYLDSRRYRLREVARYDMMLRDARLCMPQGVKFNAQDERVRASQDETLHSSPKVDRSSPFYN